MRLAEGLGVLHLFCSPSDRVDHDAVIAAVTAAEQADCQVITAAMLGHKCDLALMALCADWRVLRGLQTALSAAGLVVVDSYVSLTEVSEYAKGMPAEMIRARLNPQIPPEGMNAFCFYPMSKRREGHANWYATPYEDRNEMMLEHGRSGRAFAGKVAQLVTGSTGLDDYEWGVTLFGTGLEVIKDVVYTMRFDRGSALYGEFGAFLVGYLAPIHDVLTEVVPAH